MEKIIEKLNKEINYSKEQIRQWAERKDKVIKGIVEYKGNGIGLGVLAQDLKEICDALEYHLLRIHNIEKILEILGEQQ